MIMPHIDMRNIANTYYCSLRPDENARDYKYEWTILKIEATEKVSIVMVIKPLPIPYTYIYIYIYIYIYKKIYIYNFLCGSVG